MWVADEKEVWLQAEVTCNPSNSGAGIDLEVCGEKKVSVRGALPPLRNPDILIGANDLTSLSYLHEPAGELNIPFKNDDHYRMLFLLVLCSSL